MKERTGLVTMKGQSLTLLGDEVKVGQKAPDFEVVANDLSTVKFSSFQGNVCIISSVPSLDTSVCDKMTRRFNEEADNLGEDVVVLTISMDLPFAQKRWCGVAETHMLFIGEIIACQVLDSDMSAMTYSYYRDLKQGRLSQSDATFPNKRSGEI